MLEATIAPLLGSYKIVLIDDGSVVPVSSFLRAQGVFVLRHGINLGQGAALQTGMDFAKLQHATAVVHFDADGQHNYLEIPLMLAPILASEADFVLGSRFLSPQHIAQIPQGRRWLLRAARAVNYLFTGLYLSDAHNGFRALSQKALENTQLTECRMAHATEILQIIKKSQLPYTEVPTHIVYTDYSKQKGQSSLNAINIFFDLLLKNLF